MRAGPDRSIHLTYCSNIHPGDTWNEVISNLKEYVPTLKARLAPDRPFGLGLRLSNRAAKTLLENDRLQRLQEWLDAEDLYVFTLNGFPYGNFHGETIKENVYAPDWRAQERVTYTRRLIEILAHVLPNDLVGSISTSPLSYKPWIDSGEVEDTFRIASRHLAEITAHLSALEDETGTRIHIDLEPEPDCLIENTAETVRFFEEWLWPVGAQYLKEELNVSTQTARSLLQRHVQVCYDTCHFAVEYETAPDAFQAFSEAGIRIGKIQVSSALRVPLSDNRDDVEQKLRPFAEDTYLHQVVERRTDGSLHRYPDLPDALPHVQRDAATEWRIHYHVPIYANSYDGLESTRNEIVRAIENLPSAAAGAHVEIETYTWDVLPSALKEDLGTSIRREYEWILSNLD